MAKRMTIEQALKAIADPNSKVCRSRWHRLTEQERADIKGALEACAAYDKSPGWELSKEGRRLIELGIAHITKAMKRLDADDERKAAGHA